MSALQIKRCVCVGGDLLGEINCKSQRNKNKDQTNQLIYLVTIKVCNLHEFLASVIILLKIQNHYYMPLNFSFCGLKLDSLSIS